MEVSFDAMIRHLHEPNGVNMAIVWQPLSEDIMEV